MSTTPQARSDRRGSPSLFIPLVICFVAVVLVIALVIWNYERQEGAHGGDEDLLHGAESEQIGESADAEVGEEAQAASDDAPIAEEDTVDPEEVPEPDGDGDAVSDETEEADEG